MLLQQQQKGRGAEREAFGEDRQFRKDAMDEGDNTAIAIEVTAAVLSQTPEVNLEEPEPLAS